MWKNFLNNFPWNLCMSDSTSKSPASPHPGTETVPSETQIGGAGRSASVKKMSSAIFPSCIIAGLEPLVSSRDTPSHEKIICKLDQCCVVMLDLSDHSSNSAQKELKRQSLMEVLEFFGTPAASPGFTDPLVSASCKMFAANLFRALPPNRRINTPRDGENDAEEPVFDPAWPHLHLVYDTMLRFIASPSLNTKISKKYIDHAFILRLLDLFNSEDPRERDSLKSVLHRIYEKFMFHRPFIRKAVSNVFYRFVLEVERHNGITELLEVYGSVISGFALPLKEEHKLFLWKALIPLHKPRFLGAYLQQLTYCVTQFIDKEPNLASSVIKGLLKYWPATNTQKEVMFLSELEEILDTINVTEFQKYMVPMFRRIGQCLNSSHFQVAERALFLWNNDHVINLMTQNIQVIMPIIFPALERNARNHWNQSVLNVTLNVRKIMSEMDDELFMVCERKFEEGEEKQKKKEEMRRLAWEQLENAAASIDPVTGNTGLLVTPLMSTSITVVG